jgi:hypothetical protein
VRYTGPGRSPWPLIATIVVVVIAVALVYLLFFQ